MAIAEALKLAQEHINQTALKAGRNPESVKLIAVSKTVDAQRVSEAIQAGATILGENRVQEAKAKIEALRPELTPPFCEGRIEWHLIGSLQKNKAKTAVQLFDLIHSVDSISLAEDINKHAASISKVQRILVQVKLGDEITKHGIAEDDVLVLLDRVTALEHVSFEGLMAIPPYFENPEDSRPYFQRLNKIAQQAVKSGYPVKELSMGMSNDYEVAIEEGATMVRIGTFIFGNRN